MLHHIKYTATATYDWFLKLSYDKCDFANCVCVPEAQSLSEAWVQSVLQCVPSALPSGSWPTPGPGRTLCHVETAAPALPCPPPAHTHVWAIASSHIFLSCFNTLSLQPHLPPYLNILQVLYISCVVSIPLTVLNDFKPPSADSVHNRTAVGEELHIADLQQAPIVCKPGDSQRKRTRCYRDHGYRLWNLSAEESTSLHWPFEVVCQTHAKAVGSRLHASANHQPVAGLEDMERTRHSGEGHGAHEYRHILVKTEGRQE